MDTLDERLATFRGYVADATADDARCDASRSWQQRRRRSTVTYLVPAVGMVFIGLIVALVVSRDEPHRAVPATRSTVPSVTDNVRPAPGTTTDAKTPPATTSATTGTQPARTSSTTKPSTSVAVPPAKGDGGSSVIASCGEIVVEPPSASGGYGLIYAIRDVRGISCAQAKRIAGQAARNGVLASGWQCDADSCWEGGDPAEAYRRFTYVFGGDAG